MGKTTTQTKEAAPAAGAPLFSNQARLDAGYLQKTFKARRDHIRKEKIAPEEAAFDDGLESYVTADADQPGKTLATFRDFALPLTPLYQGQVMQDVWALFEADGKREGYFVDFGATNGTTLSNSYILEKFFDWTGIVAEPNPTYHERLHKVRKCHVSTKCVHSVSGKELEFICADRPMFSRLEVASEGVEIAEDGIEQRVQVPTISLNDLLDEHDAPGVIDFISIDTEGSELDILSTFDFGPRRVNMFAIEHNFEPRRDPIFELMSAQGYVRRFPELSRFDDWYVHRDVL